MLAPVVSFSLALQAWRRDFMWLFCTSERLSFYCCCGNSHGQRQIRYFFAFKPPILPLWPQCCSALMQRQWHRLPIPLCVMGIQEWNSCPIHPVLLCRNLQSWTWCSSKKGVGLSSQCPPQAIELSGSISEVAQGTWGWFQEHCRSRQWVHHGIHYTIPRLGCLQLSLLCWACFRVSFNI